MKKRVISVLLALVVFISVVAPSRQSVNAIAVVDDAIIWGVAGAMIAGAGYYVADDSGYTMRDVGKAFVQSNQKNYDTIKAYIAVAGYGAGMVAEFGKDSISDLKYLFDAIHSKFANGGSIDVGGELYKDVVCGGRWGKWYGKVASLESSYGGVCKYVMGSPKITSSGAEVHYVFNGIDKAISIPNVLSYYHDVVSGNYGFITVGGSLWIGSYSADGKYDTWGSWGWLSDNVRSLAEMVACPEIPNLPIDNLGVFDKWKDSISDGADVIVRPEAPIPVSNWGSWDKLYSPNGVIQGVDVFGDGSNIGVGADSEVSADGLGKDVITNWGLDDITDDDLVGLPEGIYDHAVDDAGVSTDTGTLSGIGDLLGGILGHIKALPVALATAIGAIVVGTGTLDFSGLRNAGLTTIFPFCIPFDIVNGLTAISADGVSPKFVLSFDGTIMECADDIVLDLTKFEVLAKIVRFFIFMTFALGLAKITRGLVKG